MKLGLAEILHLETLIIFLKTHYASKSEKLNALIKHKKIIFDLLLVFFQPNSVIYMIFANSEKPRCCRGTLVMLWACALAVLAGGGAWAWANYLQTYHFAVVQEGVLYRDGNRGIREFETALRKSGARTVVSLIDDQELADANKPQFAEEMALCQRQAAGFREQVAELHRLIVDGAAVRFRDVLERSVADIGPWRWEREVVVDAQRHSKNPAGSQWSERQPTSQQSESRHARRACCALAQSG